MTDIKKIIEDLEYARYHCTSNKGKDAINNALDLINRQKAEIERLSNSAKQWEDTAKDLFISKEEQQAKIDNLKMVLEAVEDHINPLPFETDYAKAIRQTKAEAIKEFAERLKDDMVPNIDDSYIESFVEEYIDNLVKEIIGDTE